MSGRGKPGDTEFLSVEDLLRLIPTLEIEPDVDVGLVAAAADRPAEIVLGREAYPTLELKAAALLHSLARTQPLGECNNRLAWLATVTFLDLNGHAPAISADEACAVVRDAASGSADAATIAPRLRVRPNT